MFLVEVALLSVGEEGGMAIRSWNRSRTIIELEVSTLMEISIVLVIWYEVLEPADSVDVVACRESMVVVACVSTGSVGVRGSSIDWTRVSSGGTLLSIRHVRKNSVLSESSTD